MRELEAQTIEDRSSYGSAAVRMSNIAKIQDIERRQSGEPPPEMRRFMDGAIRPINSNDPPMVSISPNIPAAIRAISHGDFREAVETAERAQQTARDAARDAAMAANRPKQSDPFLLHNTHRSFMATRTTLRLAASTRSE